MSRRVEKDNPFGIGMEYCRAVQCFMKGGTEYEFWIIDVGIKNREGENANA